MQRFGKTGLVLVLGLACYGQTLPVMAQSDAPRAAPPTVTNPTEKRHCQSLKMAAELVDELDLSEPLAAMLWAEIGKCQARSGDVDATRRRLLLKEPPNAQALLIMARAEIGVALAKALAADDRLKDAEQAIQQIPAYLSDQRCIAYADVAQVRAAQGHLEDATRLWGLAELAIADELNVKQRAKSERVIIRSLANSGRLDDAKKRAASLEAKSDDRRGWEPVAEKLALDGDSATAKKIVESKLTGLNQELHQFIAKVAPAGDIAAARTALRQMDDPAMASTACHVLAVAMAIPAYKDLAVIQLKESWTYMDKAKPDPTQTGLILLSGIDPNAVLAGVQETLPVCEALAKKFPPHLGAEAYRRLATHCPPKAKEEAARYLGMADRLTETIRDPIDQTTCLQKIARTRSALLGEEYALRPASQIKGTLNRGYALLGVAEGQLFPESK
ncbi:MAG: hypothetical protein U0941_29140 [Planctomycetaceae bacterium]